MINLTSFLAAVDLGGLWAALLEGDILGFIAGCYTITMGTGFYALIILTLFGIVYSRSRNLGLIVVMWTMFGWIFILLAPEIAPITIVLYILGITGGIWLLLTGRK